MASSAFNRVVVLVDMDCFYVQVEQRREPSLKGKPCAVVQYTRYQGGGIIAVGYEARSFGVSRGMWGDAAKELCSDIHLFRVPEANGKANLDRYRDAGAEVINVLSQFGGRVERASIDEAYIDLTDVVDKIISKKRESEYLTSEKLPNTHVVGWPVEYAEEEDKETQRFEGMKKWLEMITSENAAIEDVRLTIAGAITEDIRAAVYHQTGFRCSAGICHNKMLSKLSCGIHKPNKQSILPKASISTLFSTMKIGKVRNLGGKLGKSLVENFGVKFMGELDNIPIEKLVNAFGQKSALWLHEVCKGIDNEPVKERHVAQSIGCGKNFLGPDILNTKTKVKTWMGTLLNELSERLEKDKAANNRIAKTLTVYLKLETGKSLSRSCPLLKYAHEDLFKQCMLLIQPLDTLSSREERWYPGIINMSVNAKKFESVSGAIFKHTKSPSKNMQKTIKESSTFSQTANAKRIETFSKDVIEHTKSQSKSTQKNIEESFDFSKTLDKKSLFTQTGLNTVTQSSSSMSRNHGNDDFTSENSTMVTKKEGSNFGVNGPSSFNNFESETKIEILTEKHTNSITQFLQKVTPEKLLQKSSRKVANNNDDDVIVIEDQKPSSQQRKNSFFDSVKKTDSLCKIDAMFLKEKENTQRDNIEKSFSLPDGPIFHPLFGEIDRDVFKDLPPDIQLEIMRSYKITSSVIQSSQSPKEPSCSQSTPKAKNSQRLISNFVSNSQNTTKLSPFEFSTPTSISKRKSSGPSPASSKKPKTKSPTSRKSPGNKPKKLTFSSKTNNDSVPLGFFRQRSQLNNAISKALTKPPSKFNLQQ